MVRFSWVLLASCGLLRGRPSSSPRFGGGGGGPPPPVPGFPGSPGLPGFPGFPEFEFPGSGVPGLEGVLRGFTPVPLFSVSVVVVVPLILGAGSSPGVLRKWSIFRGLGRGVSPLLGVFPVGCPPGNCSALGVYGGGCPLIYTGRFANRLGTRSFLLFGG